MQLAREWSVLSSIGDSDGPLPYWFVCWFYGWMFPGQEKKNRKETTKEPIETKKKKQSLTFGNFNLSALFFCDENEGIICILSKILLPFFRLQVGLFRSS